MSGIPRLRRMQLETGEEYGKPRTARYPEAGYTCLATLTECGMSGIAAWNVQLEKAIRKNLTLSQEDEVMFKVDNGKVAQFKDGEPRIKRLDSLYHIVEDRQRKHRFMAATTCDTSLVL